MDGHIVEYQRPHFAHSHALRWLSAVTAILTMTAFASGAPAVYAAVGKASLSSCASVTTSSATVSGWIGGNMALTFTGQNCGQTYHGSIDSSGNVTLPSTMLADTYTLSGSYTTGSQGSCIVWSITCSIVNNTAYQSTFTIDGSGNYTSSGYVYCQGYVQFTGIGTFPLAGGSGFSGSGTDPSPPTATPELTSSELVAVGFVPTVGILLYWRRRKPVTLDSADEEQRDEQDNL